MFNHLFRAEEGLDCTSLENGNSKQLNSTGCTFKTVKHKQWTWRTTCCCFNTDAVTSPLQLNSTQTTLLVPRGQFSLSSSDVEKHTHTKKQKQKQKSQNSTCWVSKIVIGCIVTFLFFNIAYVFNNEIFFGPPKPEIPLSTNILLACLKCKAVVLSRQTQPPHMTQNTSFDTIGVNFGTKYSTRDFVMQSWLLIGKAALSVNTHKESSTYQHK